MSETIFPSLIHRVIVITGPTASGKTECSLAVAERLAASAHFKQKASAGGRPGSPQEEARPARAGLGNVCEILSLDSIAVYRDMDIGTAKPDRVQRQQVPHHLIDLVAPDEEFSVAEYLSRLHRCVAAIEDRGRLPILVGGTPMYLKGVVHGFDPGPPADEAFRQAVLEDVAKHGGEKLHQRLQQVDPLSAHRIHVSDVRRMIRALEFYRATGVPISHRQKQFAGSSQPSNLPTSGRLFVMTVPRTVLHQQIERRTERMFEAGLIDEVRGLLQRYGQLSKTARQAVGYREVLEHLIENLPESSCRQQVLFHTRRLARRQETWLRSFPQRTEVQTHVEDSRGLQRRPLGEIADKIVGQIIETIRA